MTKLQEDLLEVYNNLAELSEVVLGNTVCPVTVGYDSGMGCLRFKCKGKGVCLRSLNYYLIRPDLITETYLLPEDYDRLMGNLERLIKSGRLLEDRTCISPSHEGFDIYQADQRNITRGTGFLEELRFISGTGRWFKWWVTRKYKDIL